MQTTEPASTCTLDRTTALHPARLCALLRAAPARPGAAVWTANSATQLPAHGGARAAAPRAARLRKVRKVLEAGVQVRLLAQRAHVAEVAVVQVRVDAEQALEHRAHHRPEVRREGLAVLLREHARVVHLRGARARATSPHSERSPLVQEPQHLISGTTLLHRALRPTAPGGERCMACCSRTRRHGAGHGLGAEWRSTRAAGPTDLARAGPGHVPGGRGRHLRLYPVEQGVDVLWRGQADGLPHFQPIRPQVLVLRKSNLIVTCLP
jgi:hypothetical protein